MVWKGVAPFGRDFPFSDHVDSLDVGDCCRGQIRCFEAVIGWVIRFMKWWSCLRMLIGIVTLTGHRKKCGIWLDDHIYP